VDISAALADSPPVQKYSPFGPPRGRNTSGLGPSGAEILRVWAPWVHLCGRFRASGEVDAAWSRGAKSRQGATLLRATVAMQIRRVHESAVLGLNHAAKLPLAAVMGARLGSLGRPCVQRSSFGGKTQCGAGGAQG
jgi:hypothetical protein